MDNMGKTVGQHTRKATRSHLAQAAQQRLMRLSIIVTLCLAMFVSIVCLLSTAK